MDSRTAGLGLISAAIVSTFAALLAGAFLIFGGPSSPVAATGRPGDSPHPPSTPAANVQPHTPAGSSPTRPQDGPGGAEKWTHAELIDYLKGRGLKFNAEKVNGRRATMLFARPSVDKQELYTRALTIEEGGGALASVRENAAIVTLTTPEEARETWGTMPDQSYAFGRFLFVGDPSFIKEIAAACR